MNVESAAKVTSSASGRGQSAPPARRRSFLFLQGPHSPFFVRLANALEAQGHTVARINLCVGDTLFWRRSGAVNFRGRSESWPRFVADIMEKGGVTDLVLLGEQRAHHKVAIAAARERGVAVTVTDFGYLRPDWITLEKNGMSAESLFPRDPDAIRRLAADLQVPDFTPMYRDSFWTMARWDILYNLSTSLFWFLFPHYRRHLLTHPIGNYVGTGVRLALGPLRSRRAEDLIGVARSQRTPYFVFPLQMPSDFSIRAYSPYEDLHTAIREVITSFAFSAPADAQLLVKVHPLDPGLVGWRRFVEKTASQAGIGGRVAYLDGGSLEALLESARGVVTVNSTVGLWALRAGRPVITLGDAIYDVDGMTFQGALDAFWTESSPPDQELFEAFVRALASTIQIRGVYYLQPGLDAAVAAAADRLGRGLVNAPVPAAACVPN